MLHRPLAALVAVLLALALVACGGETTTRPRRRPPRLRPSRPPPRPPEFPVTVEGDNGPLTLEEEPDAIVSLSATATESLFAIGAGDQVIAVDDQSNYPADAPMTDLSGFQPNVEAIAGYEPDLVIAVLRPGRARRRTGEARHPRAPAGCRARPPGRVRPDRDAGRRHRALRRGDRAWSRRWRRRSRRRPRSRAAPGATVYHELGPDFYSATSETFIGSVYALLGLTNIADEAADAGAGGYPQLTAEYIVDANPDLIVLADTKCCEQTAATVAKRPAGSRSTRSPRATSSRPTTTSPLAGGRGPSTSSS